LATAKVYSDTDMTEFIMVKAELTMLSTENGGRVDPITKDVIYRPNHLFGATEVYTSTRSFHIGQIELIDRVELAPGDKADVIVKFLPTALLEKILIENLEWEIYEMPRLVGRAKVVELLGKKLGNMHT
jgi:translation elongation factor EF-Tu-like GTPase